MSQSAAVVVFSVPAASAWLSCTVWRDKDSAAIPGAMVDAPFSGSHASVACHSISRIHSARNLSLDLAHTLRTELVAAAADVLGCCRKPRTGTL